MERGWKTTAAALVALLVPYALLVRRYAFVCDDAFITWRYSRNWALGHGPRYNLGAELPVEGYSDFLWMAIGAVVHALHLDPTRVVPLLSAGTGLLLLGLVLLTLLDDLELPLPIAWTVALGLAVSAPFAVWATSGLETMPQALLMYLTWHLLGVRDGDRRAPVAAGVAGLLLALVRTEGIAWVAVLAGVAALQRLVEGRAVVRPLARALVPVVAGYAVYFAWRYGYYHSLVANTAYAKVHMTGESLVRGVQYVALFAANLLTPLLIVPALPLAARHARPAVGVGAGVVAVGVAAYAVTVSGDYMAWFRLMVPALPFLTVCLGAAAGALDGRLRSNVAVPVLALAAAVITFLPTQGLMIVPRPIRVDLDIREKNDAFRNENDQWVAMVHHVRDWREKGEALKAYARPDDTLVAAAIGCVGYYSDLFVYDRNGLVTREVAMLPWSGVLRSPGHDKTVSSSFFLDRKPTILDARLVAGAPIARQIREAVRDMDARLFQDAYFPDVVRLTNRRHVPRALVVLRRAETREEAAAGWERFQKTESGPR